MINLSISKAETGFIVTEGTGAGVMSRQWAFETAEAMTEFILGWGQGFNPVVVKESDIDMTELNLGDR